MNLMMRSRRGLNMLALMMLVMLMFSSGHLVMAASASDSEGPIPAKECEIVNPNPTITSCTAYPTPTTDLFANLPYDTVDEYKQCVANRCVCDGQATTPDEITPSGIHCSAAGWNASGFQSCNSLMGCFGTFWICLTDAIMDRYNDAAVKPTMSASELAVVDDIISHGSTLGQDFTETQVYASCVQNMCAAAETRKNCGLITCLPQPSQCMQYITPPPAPYSDILCTRGCVAGLVIMAVVLFALIISLCCCACCPARVKVLDPVIAAKESS